MSTRHTGTDPEPNSPTTPDPTALTWARAHLREQIQRAGTGLAPTVGPADSPKREEDRSPLADREIEP